MVVASLSEEEGCDVDGGSNDVRVFNGDVDSGTGSVGCWMGLSG